MVERERELLCVSKNTSPTHEGPTLQNLSISQGPQLPGVGTRTRADADVPSEGPACDGHRHLPWARDRFRGLHSPEPCTQRWRPLHGSAAARWQPRRPRAPGQRAENRAPVLIHDNLPEMNRCHNLRHPNNLEISEEIILPRFMHSPHAHSIQNRACHRGRKKLDLKQTWEMGALLWAESPLWGQACYWVNSVLCYWVKFVFSAFPINMGYSLWGPSVHLLRFLFPHTKSHWSTHNKFRLIMILPWASCYK